VNEGEEIEVADMSDAEAITAMCDDDPNYETIAADLIEVFF
jgi:hypothetical protein